MIIKYYSYVDQSIYIIDGVQDVAVPSNPAFGDYALHPWKVFNFDTSLPTDYVAKAITFSKDGPCMLRVYGTAYICNDAGKTIEKVVNYASPEGQVSL